MENHPIPQDVTGFQFKLIGSMTLKQFILLAIPVVFAFMLYYTPLPFYIKYPFILLFGLTGLILAFIPIEGRPADVMIKHFIHALLSPNQYLYEKQGRVIAFAAIDLQKAKQEAKSNVRRDNTKELQLQTYLQTTKTSNNPLDAKESAFLQTLQQYSPQPAAPPPPHQSAFGLPIHLPKLGFPFGQTKIGINEPNGAKEKSGNIPSAPAAPATVMPTPFNTAGTTPLPAETKEETIQTQAQIQAPQVDVAAQLRKMQEEKEKLERELQNLRGQVSPQTNILEQKPIQTATQSRESQEPGETPPASNSVAQTKETAVKTQQTSTAMAEPHVSKIPKDMAQKLGLPNIPESPNLITGLVRDPRGNVLANMLVEVKDKQGNPVRAFKTNQLGQFASATPLMNGTYTITFEDPTDKNKFDTIEITAKGEIISPISIVSHDAREELRKALFN